MKTRYVTIEGTDGAGKTTLFNNLVQFLRKNLHYNVLSTKEFGSLHSPFCTVMRSIVLNSTYEATPLSMQLGFASIVAQHHEKVISPALKSQEYDYIVSDRGIDSNYAYAGGHGLEPEDVRNIFNTVYKNFQTPDITIFLNIDPKLALERREGRPQEIFKGGGVDAVESKGMDLQFSAREKFLQRAEQTDRIKIIDVTEEKSQDDILIETLLVLGELDELT